MAKPAPSTNLTRGAPRFRTAAAPEPAVLRHDPVLARLPPLCAAPTLARASRPGQPVARAERAVLGLAGLALSRRPRARAPRLERVLVGSALLHAVLLALLAILYAQAPGPQTTQDQTPVQMVFGRSGMVGHPTAPDYGGGNPRPPQPRAIPTPPAPPAPQPPTVNPEVPPAVLPVPVPELEPLPEPAPEIPSPPPPRPPRRIPLRAAPPPARPSPFSNPMDLSFSQAQPGPPRRRAGRASGSSAPVDLSLGPLVKNGHLNTPYATVASIKGVSDDYSAEIDAWIRRHLYYPPEAAARGEDGPSHVHVVIDREGRVRSVSLVSSSGSYALDGATEGMFRNARLPPVPPDMAGSHFEIDLTVNYILIR